MNGVRACIYKSYKSHLCQIQAANARHFKYFVF